MGRGVIDAPLSEIAAFIKNVESSFTWDRFVIVSNTVCFVLILDRVSKQTSIVSLQEAKCLKVYSASDSHQDYLGKFSLSSNKYPRAVYKYGLHTCVTSLLSCATSYYYIPLAGYQQYETTQCLITLKRDMLYYIRCKYLVSF